MENNSKTAGAIFSSLDNVSFYDASKGKLSLAFAVESILFFLRSEFAPYPSFANFSHRESRVHAVSNGLTELFVMHLCIFVQQL